MWQILLIFIFFPLFVFSQQTYTGIIKNAKTKEPLAFANINTSDSKLYHTNIFGKFEFHTNKKNQEIMISYVGYHPKKIQITNTNFYYEIFLDPKIESLNEVIIQAKDNEAIKIIKNTIAEEPKNNILKNISNFSYDAYNKTIITANPDSITTKIDSIFKTENNKRVLKKVDSSGFKIKSTLEKRHLFISEKISKFHYKKGSEIKEEIMATRVAGFRQPLYEMLTLNFSDFNVYDDEYIIAGTKYINPISNKGLQDYRYKILDTVKNSIGNDSFMIHFKTKKIESKAGLEGVLFVDANQYSITKAILELKGLIYVKLTQDFEFDEQLNNWFGLEKELIITKGTNDKNISLFGNMIKFEPDEKENEKEKKDQKEPSDYIYFSSKTINSNIVFNDVKPIASFAEKIKISDNAHLKKEDFWGKYRIDSISKKELNTYQVIDSIALKRNIEHKLELFRELSKGFYPTKYFKINLGNIFTLNNYEGLRLGIGGETNQNISNKFKLDGYVAYGTKDNNFKYQYGASARLNKYHNTWFGLNYTNDIKEAASLDFMLENTSFALINPRNLNISDFYHYKTYSAHLIHDILPNLESKFKLSTGEYETVFDYAFLDQSELKSNYHLTNLSVGFLYTPFSEYMQTPIGKRKISSGYTDFLLQATQSFDGFLEGEFDFSKFIFRANHRIPFKKDNFLYLMLQGGVVLGEAPMTHLFNATPNYTLKSPWIKRVTFGGKNSFETMQYNEFISDRYLMFQVHQHLRNFNLGKFKPQVTLISRVAFGNLSNKENHQLIQFNTMEKGYFESGMEMNNLFKGFGISTFYRYGPYHHQKISDNIALKITYRLRLGF